MIQGGLILIKKLSVCIITFNEEDNICRCLESASFADEIIVIDSGSTDRTVELARRFTSRVIQREWPGFGPQKEFAFSQAMGDWIMSIDADEAVTPELRDEILAALDNPGDYDGFRFPRKNLIGSYWIKYGLVLYSKPSQIASSKNLHPAKTRVSGIRGVVKTKIM